VVDRRGRTCLQTDPSYSLLMTTTKEKTMTTTTNSHATKEEPGWIRRGHAPVHLNSDGRCRCRCVRCDDDGRCICPDCHHETGAR
jgi:hypothetical protein